MNDDPGPAGRQIDGPAGGAHRRNARDGEVALPRGLRLEDQRSQRPRSLEALPARRGGIADRANPGIIVDVLEKGGLVAGLARHPALRDIFEAHQLRIVAEDHGHVADLLVAAQIDRDPEFDVGSKVEIGR
jgi:hypothetical protein